jgi:transcriptional regulator with XRE-family HTH domain
MKVAKGFGKALRLIRLQRKLTQEDFGLLSSRTYLSSLERGLKSPTLSKITQLSQVLRVHPMTLLTLAFCYAQHQDPARILERVNQEISLLKLRR